MSRLTSNLQIDFRTVQSTVDELARQAGRQVVLLAVTKTQPVEVIRAVCALGQNAVAENYVQEALAKMAELVDLPLQWHFIGPLQSNKTKDVALHFGWVHSVDREKVARRLSEARPATLPPLNVCVQVNISGEQSKSGTRPEEVEALCHAVAAMPRLRLRGLMSIGQAGLDEPDQRRQFRAMKTLFDRINATALAMDTLSMGMTEDMKAAILEGATMVRVGTAIFGRRTKAKPLDVAMPSEAQKISARRNSAQSNSPQTSDFERTDAEAHGTCAEAKRIQDLS